MAEAARLLAVAVEVQGFAAQGLVLTQPPLPSSRVPGTQPQLTVPLPSVHTVRLGVVQGFGVQLAVATQVPLPSSR